MNLFSKLEKQILSSQITSKKAVQRVKVKSSAIITLINKTSLLEYRLPKNFRADMPEVLRGIHLLLAIC
jgi:hypothetical protein